jgi:hypothetical protein
MTKVKRIIDETLHVGDASYLIGEARTGVPYPVLEDVLDGEYKTCVATAPFDGSASLFYRIYEPTRTMRVLATDTLPGYSGRPTSPVTREKAIWRNIRMVHRKVFSSSPEARRQAAQRLPNIARDLSETAGETVSPLSLAAAAFAYQETGALPIANSLAASVIPASLLVMAGMPRELVACFGLYYQDPIQNRTLETDWVGGFYVPSPTHIMFGAYIGTHWVPVDFTRQPREPGETLPSEPLSYLRNPDFGQREDDGAPRIVDYAHPYTAVFPPPSPDEPSFSLTLKYIPLL